MPKGKTVSLSDDLARMLDEEARHASTVAHVEVSRGQVAAGILKPELERRMKERAALDVRPSKKVK